MANAYKADIDLLTANDDGLADRTRFVFFVHTFEGADVDALTMATYQLSPAAGGSYHGVIDVNGGTARENDDAYIPWAAMFTANRVGYHWSLAGKAAFTREQWLARPKQLSKLAEVIAAYAKAYGLPMVKRNDVELVQGKWGVAGHADASRAWKESDHTDPGANFPYDVVLDRANKLLNSGDIVPPAAPAPAPKGDFVGNKYPSYLDGRELRFSEYIRHIDFKVTKTYEKLFGPDADLGIKPGTFDAGAVGQRYPSYIDGSKSFTIDQYIRLIDIKQTRIMEHVLGEGV